MRRPVELSFKQIINSVLYPASNPLGEMWFIVTLFIIFLFYPVFKWSLQWNKCSLGCVYNLNVPHIVTTSGLDLSFLSIVEWLRYALFVYMCASLY